MTSQKSVLNECNRDIVLSSCPCPRLINGRRLTSRVSCPRDWSHDPTRGEWFKTRGVGSSRPMNHPKTPSRFRSRSDAKTPLTPSIVAQFNAVSLGSPQKRAHPADLSNPFLVRSRAASPVKRTTSAAAPAPTSNAGVIRKGGVESRLDVVSHDYHPPRPELKRSRSTPSTRERTLSHSSDRFITAREDAALSSGATAAAATATAASPGHTARLANATGVPLNKRVLAYHEPPPASSSSTFLSAQRTLARPLYARDALPSSNGTASAKSRRVPTTPERVLDAPGMVDDFYLNLVSWSALNVVGVALGESTYLWAAETGNVSHLGDAPDDTYVASLDFSGDGAYLGIGLGTGSIELWDVASSQKLRTMAPSSDATSAGQVASLGWFNHVLTSGHSNGSIVHHDVRVPRHVVATLQGHTGEVCGLRWSPGGEVIASGGNDNVVNLWDGRGGDVSSGARGAPKWTKRNHTAAVKALAFSPWSPLLASGGGTSDTCIHIVLAYLGFEGRQGKKEDGGQGGGGGCDSGDFGDSVRSLFSVSFVGFSLRIPSPLFT
jgi:cell division cycle protein 20 (cofactor of APC complex)